MASATASEERSTPSWAWWALGAGMASVGSAIAWGGWRRAQGPPEARSLESVGASLTPASLPAETFQPPLPPPGVKATSYPGPSEPRAPASDWEQLTPAPGLVVRNRNRAWGTPKTIASLQRAARRWVELRPSFALSEIDLRVADISKKGGGPLPPHKSHHEGRDADVTLVGLEGKLPIVALPLMLRVFLEDANVKAIFLDWQRQRQVWDALELNPELGAGLVKPDLQYPLAPHSGRTRVRHWPGHANHLHVRFRA